MEGRARTLRYAGKWHPHPSQLVLTVLAGWGLVIYSAVKIFGGKKKEPEPAA